jgi:hypothetical protein
MKNLWKFRTAVPGFPLKCPKWFVPALPPAEMLGMLSQGSVVNNFVTGSEQICPPGAAATEQGRTDCLWCQKTFCNENLTSVHLYHVKKKYNLCTDASNCFYCYLSFVFYVQCIIGPVKFIITEYFGNA